jgi:enoyl-CoA hydratase
MAEGSHLVFSQARLGLLTGWGGTARLVRAVGVSASMQILMTGQYLTALRAKELGLVAEVAPDGFALAGALDLARQITRHPREAIEALKAVILAASAESFDRALEVENEWFGKRWCSP